MQVLISGAGIAGPTLAFWLNKYGIAPMLVEAAPALRTSGYVIDGYGGIHERLRVCNKLMHAFLLLEVINHSIVYAGELFVALLAPGVWQAAGIEDEASAIARWIYRHFLMKGKTEDAYGEDVSAGRELLKFLGSEHSLEGFHQRG